MCVNPISIKRINEETKQEELIKVGCGKCLLCCKKKASNWAIKLIKENLYHKKSCMITLTFDSKKLLDGEWGSNIKYAKNLKHSKEHFVKFMKRLRKHLKNQTITYFKVGEYGEKNHRAHYHLIVFGLDKNDFPDVKIWEKSKKGKETYRSEKFEKIWGLGICTFSDITNNSIKYVANYTLKKIRKNSDEIERIEPLKEHKELKKMDQKEYESYMKERKKKEREKTYYRNIISFSNKAKIGAKWARKHHKDLRKGFAVDNENKKYGIPKAWIREFRRWEDGILDIRKNYNMIATAEIIKEHYEKLKDSPTMQIENLKRKAKNYKLYLEKEIRDFT